MKLGGHNHSEMTQGAQLVAVVSSAGIVLVISVRLAAAHSFIHAG